MSGDAVGAVGAAEYPPMHATQVTFRSASRALVVCSSLLWAGCVSTPPAGPGLAVAPTQPVTVPVQAIDPTPALDQARRRLREARHRGAQVASAARMLDRAESAAAGGQTLRALRLARRADVLAEVAMNDHFAVLARAEYAELRQRTRLSERQAADMRAAEQAMAAREYRQAYDVLARINQTTRLAELAYRVARGDSLWRIAARPDVYDNGFLWPLIFQANRHQLSSPSDLAVGVELSIPRHPTVEAIYEALVTSGGLGKGQVSIGVPRVAESASARTSAETAP